MGTPFIDPFIVFCRVGDGNTKTICLRLCQRRVAATATSTCQRYLGTLRTTGPVEVPWQKSQQKWDKKQYVPPKINGWNLEMMGFNSGVSFSKGPPFSGEPCLFWGVYVPGSINSHYFHIIGDKLINPIVGVYRAPL